MAPCPEFCVYHIIHKADPIGLFPVTLVTADGDNNQPRTRKEDVQAKSDSKIQKQESSKKYWANP
ncbi:hypothetical protein LTS06_011969 [Exophiala xenobiotica]|nr:hypothetical protein LTS06_011969 [Exophiala xenobiotica]